MDNTEVCTNCGKFVDPSDIDDFTGWCRECSPAIKSSLTAYLTANADEIEHYLLQGKSLNQAIDLLHSKNGRPRCLCCGDVITRAPRNAVFCRRRAECRKQSRRYVYLYREKGMSKAEAFAQMLGELG